MRPSFVPTEFRIIVWRMCIYILRCNQSEHTNNIDLDTFFISQRSWFFKCIIHGACTTIIEPWNKWTRLRHYIILNWKMYIHQSFYSSKWSLIYLNTSSGWILINRQYIGLENIILIEFKSVFLYNFSCDQIIVFKETFEWKKNSMKLLDCSKTV